MDLPQFNSPQMEFDFAETVTGNQKRKGRICKRSVQLRTDKLAETAGVAADAIPKSSLNIPTKDTNKSARRIDWTEAPGVFGNEWIECVCGNIRSACDLREAVALSACYLTDLIDYEIDVRGHNEAWKEEYEAYCWTRYYSLTVETETELEELRAMWWMAAIVLNTDHSASDRSDWELFEDLCNFDGDFAKLDGTGAEASFIEFLAMFLSSLHQHLFRSSGGIFTGQNLPPLG